MSRCTDDCCTPQDALKQLGQFAQTWELGNVIDPSLRGTLTRAAMERLLARRARRNPRLMEELRKNARHAYMVALEDAFGIAKIDFLCQVREVRFFEESAECLYLAVPDESSQELLQQEEWPALSRTAASEDAPARLRWEAGLLKRVGQDPSLRRELLFNPTSTYLDWVRRQAPESNGELDPVKEVRPVVEKPDSLVFVLPHH